MPTVNNSISCVYIFHVFCRVDGDGRELLVAVSFGLAASEAVADRRSSFQIKRWEAYARLYKKVWFLDCPAKPEQINGEKSMCQK